MKIDANKITVNGKVYVPEDSIQQPEVEGDVKIVILQRAWVMIGFFERNGSDCKLHNASIIRRWGTSRGLGELVDGPLPETKLDKCGGVVEFDYLTVVASIACKEEKWKSVL